MDSSELSASMDDPTNIDEDNTNDTEQSLLYEEEPNNELRRASSSSSEDEDDTRTEADEAGLLTNTHHHTQTYGQGNRPGYLIEGDSVGQESSRDDNSRRLLQAVNDTSLADSSFSGTPKAPKQNHARQSSSNSNNFQRSTLSAQNKKQAGPVKPIRKPGRALAVSTTTNGTASTANEGQPKTGPRQNLTLKEQEKLIDSTKKENFSLKLKIYFLEERLAKITPEHIDTALRENIELKVNFQTLQQEVKKHKRASAELNKQVDSLQNDLEAAQIAAQSSAAAQSQVEQLQQELEDLKADHETERLQWQDRSPSSSGRGDELDQLKADLERIRMERDALKHSQSSTGEKSRLAKQVENLTRDNASLLSQVNAQVTMLGTRNAEKEQLHATIEGLKQTNLELETQVDLARSTGRRPSSSASSLRTNQFGSGRGPEEGDARQQLREMEAELNHYRDKISSVMLEMERKEAEIEDLLQDGDQRDQDHAAEVQELTVEADGLRHALDTRDKEMRQMGQKIGEFEELFGNKEADVDELLQEIKVRDAKIDELNEEIDALAEDLKKLGAQVYNLEEELADRDAHVTELLSDAENVSHTDQRHQQVVVVLKEKLVKAKTQAFELSAANETLINERNELREQVANFAIKTAETEERFRADFRQRQLIEESRDSLEHALSKEQADRSDEANRWKRQKRDLEIERDRQLEVLEKNLEKSQNDLDQNRDRLKSREADLAKLQAALRAVESKTRTHSSDRTSLELEIERLRRDLARCEDDLAAVKEDLRMAEQRASDAVISGARSESELREVEDRLRSQTKLRLELSDRLDAANKSLSAAKADLANERAKKADKPLARTPPRGAESQTKEKLAERNLLLHKIYLDLSPVLNDKSSPSKREHNPSVDFAPFTEALLAKVKQLVGLQAFAVKSIGDVERRFENKYGTLKQQHDAKSRQVDRLETAAKSAIETQRAWRQRVVLKQTELDTAKSTNQDLQTQITSLRQRIASGNSEPGASSKLNQLQSKLSATERRLMVTQAQLDDAEAKLEDGRRKLAKADDLWTARLQELQRRNRALEERIKGERQGGKERAAELLEQKQDLEKQLHAAERRRNIVTDYVDEKLVCRLSDVTNGLEPARIPLYTVTRQTALPKFQYTQNNILPFRDDVVDEGCACKITCHPKTCSCITQNGFFYHQESDTLALDKIPQMHVLYECGNCACSKDCRNRRVSLGITTELYIKETPNKSFGLFSQRQLPKGHFVSLYAGEIITSSQAKDRWQSDANADNYILVLREISSDGRTFKTIVDPTETGNIGRFANHSCEANLVIVPVRLKGHLVPLAAMFTRRPIEADEELCFDYANAGQELSLGSEPESASKTPCMCGSANCRKFMPFDGSV